MILFAKKAHILVMVYCTAATIAAVNAQSSDCGTIEPDLIQNALLAAKQCKNNCDVMERIAKTFGDDCSRWGIYYGNTRFYSIQDEVEGAGCSDTPYTLSPWFPNDLSSVNKAYGDAIITAGTCSMPGFSWSTCEPRPIKKESFNRPVNECPRVYCVTSADPRVAGEYWEDTDNFLQDKVPRYYRVDIDITSLEECLNPPSQPPTETPLPPKVCPEDIVLVKTNGLTGFPETDGDATGNANAPPVTIISQDVSTVTVELRQNFFSSIDSITYSYKANDFNDKCHTTEPSVNEGELYDTVTIHCNHMELEHWGRLDICLSDDTNLSKVGDNATVPKCCQDDTNKDKPTVCYNLMIWCESFCTEEAAARNRRRLGAP